MPEMTGIELEPNAGAEQASVALLFDVRASLRVLLSSAGAPVSVRSRAPTRSGGRGA